MEEIEYLEEYEDLILPRNDVLLCGDAVPSERLSIDSFEMLYKDIISESQSITQGKACESLDKSLTSNVVEAEIFPQLGITETVLATPSTTGLSNKSQLQQSPSTESKQGFVSNCSTMKSLPLLKRQEQSKSIATVKPTLQRTLTTHAENKLNQNDRNSKKLNKKRKNRLNFDAFLDFDIDKNDAGDDLDFDSDLDDSLTGILSDLCSDSAMLSDELSDSSFNFSDLSSESGTARKKLKRKTEGDNNLHELKKQAKEKPEVTSVRSELKQDEVNNTKKRFTDAGRNSNFSSTIEKTSPKTGTSSIGSVINETKTTSTSAPAQTPRNKNIPANAAKLSMLCTPNKNPNSSPDTIKSMGSKSEPPTKKLILEKNDNALTNKSTQPFLKKAETKQFSATPTIKKKEEILSVKTLKALPADKIKETTVSNTNVIKSSTPQQKTTQAHSRDLLSPDRNLKLTSFIIKPPTGKNTSANRASLQSLSSPKVQQSTPNEGLKNSEPNKKSIDEADKKVLNRSSNLEVNKKPVDKVDNSIKPPAGKNTSVNRASLQSMSSPKVHQSTQNEASKNSEANKKSIDEADKKVPNRSSNLEVNKKPVDKVDKSIKTPAGKNTSVNRASLQSMSSPKVHQSTPNEASKNSEANKKSIDEADKKVPNRSSILEVNKKTVDNKVDKKPFNLSLKKLETNKKPIAEIDKRPLNRSLTNPEINKTPISKIDKTKPTNRSLTNLELNRKPFEKVDKKIQNQSLAKPEQNKKPIITVERKATVGVEKKTIISVEKKPTNEVSKKNIHISAKNEVESENRLYKFFNENESISKDSKSSKTGISENNINSAPIPTISTISSKDSITLGNDFESNSKGSPKENLFRAQIIKSARIERRLSRNVKEKLKPEEDEKEPQKITSIKAQPMKRANQLKDRVSKPLQKETKMGSADNFLALQKKFKLCEFDIRLNKNIVAKLLDQQEIKKKLKNKVPFKNTTENVNIENTSSQKVELISGVSNESSKNTSVSASEKTTTSISQGKGKILKKVGRKKGKRKLKLKKALQSSLNSDSQIEDQSVSNSLITSKVDKPSLEASTKNAQISPSRILFDEIMESSTNCNTTSPEIKKKNIQISPMRVLSCETIKGGTDILNSSSGLKTKIDKVKTNNVEMALRRTRRTKSVYKSVSFMPVETSSMEKSPNPITDRSPTKTVTATVSKSSLRHSLKGLPTVSTITPQSLAKTQGLSTNAQESESKKTQQLSTKPSDVISKDKELSQTKTSTALSKQKEPIATNAHASVTKHTEPSPTKTLSAARFSSTKSTAASPQLLGSPPIKHQTAVSKQTASSKESIPMAISTTKEPKQTQTSSAVLNSTERSTKSTRILSTNKIVPINSSESLNSSSKPRLKEPITNNNNSQYNTKPPERNIVSSVVLNSSTHELPPSKTINLQSNTPVVIKTEVDASNLNANDDENDSDFTVLELPAYIYVRTKLITRKELEEKDEHVPLIVKQRLCQLAEANDSERLMKEERPEFNSICAQINDLLDQDANYLKFASYTERQTRMNEVLSDNSLTVEDAECTFKFLQSYFALRTKDVPLKLKSQNFVPILNSQKKIIGYRRKNSVKKTSLRKEKNTPAETISSNTVASTVTVSQTTCNPMIISKVTENSSSIKEVMVFRTKEEPLQNDGDDGEAILPDPELRTPVQPSLVKDEQETAKDNTVIG